jgi:hypothetical protein
VTFDEDRRRELAARLTDLREGDFLVLGEPAPEPERRGFLRRSRPAPSRYVQFLRDPRWLYGECVGATSFGGDWEIKEADHQRIRALGWLAPGDPDPSGTQPSYPHYWCCLDAGAADELAAMAIGALELLGADPASLEWRAGS